MVVGTEGTGGAGRSTRRRRALSAAPADVEVTDAPAPAEEAEEPMSESTTTPPVPVPGAGSGAPDPRWDPKRAVVFFLQVGVSLLAVLAIFLTRSNFTTTPYLPCKDGQALPKALGETTTSTSTANGATGEPTTTTVPAELTGSADAASGPGQAVLTYSHREGPLSTRVILPSDVDLSRAPVVLGDVRRGDQGDATFAREAIQLALATQGDSVELRICADRTGVADPGSYSGQIEVFTKTGGTIVVPLSISLADTNMTFVTMLGVLAIWLGLLYTYALLDRLQPGDEVDLGIVKSFIYWTAEVKSLIAGAFGLAAAAAVFNAQYFASNSFGSSLWNYPTLLASMLGAFIGAASVASVPATSPRSAPPPGQAETAEVTVEEAGD